MVKTPTQPGDAAPESATSKTTSDATGAAAETVDALALVRRIRDDFAARTAGLNTDELLALIRREAAVLEPVFDRPSPGRAAA